MRFWQVTRYALMAGSALAVLAPAAHAHQAAEVQDNGSTEADSGSNDIIVTATRRNQSLQDVPVVVTAVSGEQIKELNFTTFTDIQALSPGLSFTPRGTSGTVTALRGVSTSNTTGAPPAVVIYFNEVPINDSLAFQSLYDIGQIEVVRGPQGTLRGAPAPAGSITLTTKRPDLDEVGGYAQGIATDRLGLNGQVAVNIPIIRDKLALRIAGLYDRNENGDVRSLTTGVESGASTKSIRASLLWEPLPELSILGTYQYLRNVSNTLATVEGSGLGYNGPAILNPRKRLAVQEELFYRRLIPNL